MIRQPLLGLPPHMDAFNMILETARPTSFGAWRLVDARPSPIEMQHLVTVVDENEQPLTGIRVIFGYPMGDGNSIPVGARRNHWLEAPAVMTGNAVSTLSGIAQHTVGEGGETVYIHQPDYAEDAILYASDIVKNVTWVAGVLNNHTCVWLTFQLQRTGVKSDAERLAAIEQRLDILEGGGYIQP